MKPVTEDTFFDEFLFSSVLTLPAPFHEFLTYLH